MTDRTRIEALWLEPGTAADAAIATNLHRDIGHKISAHGVREIWERAKAEGRLPQIDRPMAGFNANQAVIVRRLMKLQIGAAA